MDQIQAATICVAQARTRMIDRVRSLSVERTSFKPDPDRWCASEILEHVYSWEIEVLAHICSLGDAFCSSADLAPELPNQDQAFETIIRPFAHLKHKSPEELVPSGIGNAKFWMEALRANQEIVDALPQLLLDEDPKKIVFPHFLVGPLNAMQWLGFLQFHMDRHCMQIERLVC